MTVLIIDLGEEIDPAKKAACLLIISWCSPLTLLEMYLFDTLTWV